MLDHNPYSPPQSDSLVVANRADWPWVRDGIAIHAGCFLAGASLGFLSRLFRPYFLGHIHFEALIEFGAKIAISFAVLWLTSNIPADRPVLRFSLSILALWIGSAIGWSILNGSTWTDHLLVNANGCLITLALGVAWMGLIKKLSRH